LIRFLRLDPMAYYFCRTKGCDCRCIHYRMQQGVCLGCNHRSFTHYAHFNKHILNVIQREGYTGDGRKAMFKLKTDVLDKCLLRRTKESRAEDMCLPPRIVTIRYIRLHPIEEDFYQALYTQTKSSFEDYVAEGTLLNNYAHIFDLLTRMRQAVDHPYLIVHSQRSNVQQSGAQANAACAAAAAAVANGSIECEICHEPFTDRVLSSCCKAGFCRGCVLEYLTTAGGDDNTPCPSCRAPFTIDLNQAGQDTVDDGNLITPSMTNRDAPASAKDPTLKELTHVSTGSILRRINLADFATSTKIEVLVQSLVEMRQTRPGGKALVFSQFVNMLDLVRWRLHSDPFLAQMGLGVRILHGAMDIKSRDEALKDFREDCNCRVLLMSLKAAGVALNLTVASECYLLDLWWNVSCWYTLLVPVTILTVL
jgi:DNA repair protein RAD16